MNEKDIDVVEHIIEQFLSIDEQKELFMRFKHVADIACENEKLHEMLGEQMIGREVSKRFIFEYEYYDADLIEERMLHLTIYGNMPMQVHLYLDEFDQKKLKKFLNDGDKNDQKGKR